MLSSKLSKIILYLNHPLFGLIPVKVLVLMVYRRNNKVFVTSRKFIIVECKGTRDTKTSHEKLRVGKTGPRKGCCNILLFWLWTSPNYWTDRSVFINCRRLRICDRRNLEYFSQSSFYWVRITHVWEGTWNISTVI